MTKEFLLGGLLGFLTSFISKVKEMITTFRSFFIQRDIIEFNSPTYLPYLVKHNKIILLNKFTDRYFLIYKTLLSGHTHVVTPIVHNYSGFAYINTGNIKWYKKLGNIFYLSARKDGRTFAIYYPRPFAITDKLYDLLCNENFIRKDQKNRKKFVPYCFEIIHIKDGNTATKSKMDVGKPATGNNTPESSELEVPPYLYIDPREGHYNVKIYKANYNINGENVVQTPFDYVKRLYPLFYFSREFKTLLKYGLIWKFCNQEHYGRKVGIMLYGPPGTGKSMMVKILGIVLDRAIYVIDLLNTNQSTVVEELLRLTRYDDIILFEDIDVYFEHWKKERSTNSLYSKDIIRPSTFLNLIDGVDKQSKCMFIFTTNYPEKIDKRLVDVDEKGEVIITRPGRIDKAIKVGYAELNGIEYICKEFAKQYNAILENKGFHVRINDQELINFLKHKYAELDGKITYASVVNYCYEHLIGMLEVNHDELFKRLIDPEV